jgi:uncharacterized protein
MALDETLLEILVCPVDKRGLLYFADEDLLYNPRLRRSYRIENDIPVMLAHDAASVADEEHARLIERARSGAAVGTAGNRGLSRDRGRDRHTMMPASMPPTHSPPLTDGASGNVTLPTLPRSGR